MTDFRKPQDDLLYDLIEEANPGFKDKFAKGSFVIDNLRSYTPQAGEIANTIARLRAAPGTAAIGVLDIKYRRIDLSKLFKNISPITLTTWNSATALPIAQVIAEINQRFGLYLRVEDFPSNSAGIGSTSTAMTCTGSQCFIGQFSARYVKAKRDLDDAIVSNNGGSHDLNGRLWQGGNTFDGGRKTQGDYLTYGMDLSAVAATINGLAASGSMAAGNANLTAIVAEMNKQMGSNLFDASQAHSVQGGMGGLAYTRLSALPNASYPFANSAKYSKVLMLTAQATSWFQGVMYLHYNG